MVRRSWSAIAALLACGILSTSAVAVDVCGYSVRLASLGFRCPFSAGTTVCAPVSANVQCDVPLRCFGGTDDFCDLTLTPTSGPEAQCPLGSERLTGFQCVPQPPSSDETGSATTTPIKHLVVIFQENVSFDHYFATYPVAANPSGEPVFFARNGTPTVNGLSGALLTANRNSTQPFRLGRSQAATCDQDHDYKDEQLAFDFGLMDKFPESVGVGAPGCPDYGYGTGLVMGYYDGNTVTALWNYAQHFAMNDNSYDTTFGPSTPGALNLISGQTHGATPSDLSGDSIMGTVYGDGQPTGDACTTRDNLAMSGTNIGDLLNAKGVTWGWFQGGFDLTLVNPDGSTGCNRTHTSDIAQVKKVDYIPHHEPFQYYASTANPTHERPSSVAMIGRTDAANHQYDLADFFAALEAGSFPEVSFLKAAGYQDGHAGYSTPLDEQTFIVETLNTLQRLPQWSETAVIIAYDDSDGWYDHVMGPIVNQSDTEQDALTGSGHCGTAPTGAPEGRCGYGPRLPFLVISPFAKVNFVDHTVTDQTSPIRFMEDNWSLGQIGNGSFDEKAGSILGMLDFSAHHRAGRLFLDPSTGLESGS
jgi:phospholipase C